MSWLPWWAYPLIAVWFVVLCGMALGMVARTADLAAEIMAERRQRERS